MRKKFKRLFCGVLTLMLLCCALPAFAEAQSKTGYVISNTLKVYAGPHKAADVVETMSYGQSLQVSSCRDGWAQVTIGGGKTGFCKRSGLSAKNPNKLNSSAYVKASGATVRLRPSDDCKKSVQLSAGTHLNVVAKTKDKKWVRVKNGGTYGYVLASELADTPAAAQKKTVWIVSDTKVAVFSKADLLHQIDVCSHGQSFELVAISGDGVQIRNRAGRKGWVHHSAVTTSDPNTLNRTSYAQISGDILCKKNIGGEKKYLKKDAKVAIVSITPDGDWCRVRYGGSYYYMHAALLAPEKAPKSGRMLTSTESERPLYESTKTSSPVLATIEKGEKVKLLGAKGFGFKVETEDGTVGYVTTGDWKVS